MLKITGYFTQREVRQSRRSFLYGKFRLSRGYSLFNCHAEELDASPSRPKNQFRSTVSKPVSKYFFQLTP